MSWLRIEVGKVTAAIRLQNNLVVETAHVFSFMKGWNRARVEDWCRKNNAQAKFLPYE